MTHNMSMTHPEAGP